MKLMLIVVLMSLIGFTVAAQHSSLPFKTFKGGKNYTIGYPANWTAQAQEGAEFCFIRPVEKEGQKFRENVNMVIDPPDDLSLQEYGEVAINKMSSQMDSFRVFSAGIIDINHRKFYRVVYQFKFRKLMMKDIYYITVTDNRSYNFTCSALPGTFNEFLPIFERIIKSFALFAQPAKN